MAMEQDTGNDLSFQNLGMVYEARTGSVAALDGFSFDVRANEFITIVGPSGCGKSTLLQVTSGLQAPTSGKALLNGRSITGPSPDKAMVFQSFSLFPWKPVKQNIEFGLRVSGMSRAERDELVDYYIGVTGLTGFENHYPRQLSGGMQQRVAIARALAMRPRVLLMDEPFAALDAMNRTLMQEELVRIWSEHKPTVLFITHSVEEAVYMADKVLVMTKRPGRLKCTIDINAEIGCAHWRTQPIDEVLLVPKFQELRHRVWEEVRAEIEVNA
ncbi:MAG: ABC transporter ATP-binding protein [Roseovarius sp.]|nr:ABC transporter ATP-binding protein [Roseovarius sp.]